MKNQLIEKALKTIHSGDRVEVNEASKYVTIDTKELLDYINKKKITKLQLKGTLLVPSEGNYIFASTENQR